MSFECGSLVRVKKPGILPKTQCKFTKPLRVMEKKGQYTYLLSDGRCWNASYLAPVSLQGKDQEADGDGEPLPVDTEPATPQPAGVSPPGRPIRCRRMPEWTKDYVLNTIELCE